MENNQQRGCNKHALKHI